MNFIKKWSVEIWGGSIILIILIVSILAVFSISKNIELSGGCRQIIVEGGKDVKSVWKEINETD